MKGKDHSWSEVHELLERSAVLGEQLLMVKGGAFRLERVTFEKRHGAGYRKIHPAFVDYLPMPTYKKMLDDGLLVRQRHFMVISPDHAMRICADSYSVDEHLSPLLHAALDRAGVDRLN